MAPPQRRGQKKEPVGRNSAMSGASRRKAVLYPREAGDPQGCWKPAVEDASTLILKERKPQIIRCDIAVVSENPVPILA
ncbi:hypothetical protein NDU88_008394 [Pleurodeles waltl]|uniref:Uncharacterized protein n=1 Tax=Pleurodeles waltl TaxID=8319 RepID=A0AAV7QNH8_PLEWA|nr:hypothetical protein NDU88_008394 [Pleurodeles waltl]